MTEEQKRIAAQIAAKYSSGNDSPAQPEVVVEDKGTLASQIAAKYAPKTSLEAAPAIAEDPVVAEVPERGLLGRSYDTMVQGASDAISSIAGDTYGGGGFGGGGDPTTRDQYDPSTRARKGLGGPLAKSVNSVVGDAVSTFTPEATKKWLTGTLAAANENQSSNPIYGGSSITGEISDQFGRLPQELQEGISESTNIAIAGLPKASKVKFGDNAILKKNKAIKEQNRKDTIKLLQPDDISARDIDVSTVVGRYDYVPRDWEKRMYDELDLVDDFNPRGNNVKNVKAIDKKVTELRDNLDKSLAGKRVDLGEITDVIEDQIKLLANEPLLSGEAATSAEKIYRMFLKELDDGRGAFSKELGDSVSARELIDARRSLDAALRASAKGIFDPQAMTANTVATRNLRSAINRKVADVAPERANVMESLERQSDLLTAADKIDRIVGKEGRNALTRAMTRVETDSGITTPKTGLSTAANLGSVPAMALMGTATAASLGGRGLKNATRSISTTGQRGLQKALNSISDPAAKAAALAAINREEEIEVPYRR